MECGQRAPLPEEETVARIRLGGVRGQRHLATLSSAPHALRRSDRPGGCIRGDISHGTCQPALPSASSASLNARRPIRLPVRGRDREVAELPVLHTFNHLCETRTRPDGARHRCHPFPGGDVRTAANRPHSDSTENNASLIDYEARIPSAFVEPIADLLEWVVQATSGNVRPELRSCPTLAAVLALQPKPEAAPVRLSGDIVVDVPEPETFEPRRGSRTHVSLAVIAVGDHRTIVIEVFRRLAGQSGTPSGRPGSRI